jgi:hypothetical protein
MGSPELRPRAFPTKGAHCGGSGSFRTMAALGSGVAMTSSGGGMSFIGRALQA